MSLSQEPAFSALKNHFICGYTDITNTSYSGMSGRHDTFGKAINTTNGAGPKNLQLFMLADDGTVLHCLPGFWNPRDLVHEMSFASELNQVWKDESINPSRKKAIFKSMQLEHINTHSRAMTRRSRMQGFDMKYEADNRLKTTDTIRDRQAAIASYQKTGHVPRHAFKTTDIILHERMASRPFVPMRKFDVAVFSNYGKPVYDKNEDNRDIRTGQTIGHSRRQMIGRRRAKNRQSKRRKRGNMNANTGWGSNNTVNQSAAWGGNR